MTRNISLDALRPYVRLFVDRDLPEVLAIEQAAEFPVWSECDFQQHLRRGNCFALVAQVAERVVGFVVYELHDTEIRLLNIAVEPPARRKKIGTQLLTPLRAKISPEHRRKLVATVGERGLEALLLFRSCDFVATTVIRYENEHDDLIRMEYECPVPPNHIAKRAGAVSGVA